MADGDNVPDSEAAPMSQFESARLALARLGLQQPDEALRVMAQAARISAETLAVARVGVWCFRDADTLVCMATYNRETGEHSQGERLRTPTFPAYLAAIRSRRAVAADDAVHDPRTRELAAGYLVPNNISSMLDAPVYADGEVVGIVCHEHVGPARVWLQRDLDFAASVADMLASLFQQSRRVQAEIHLRKAQDELARSARMQSLARLAAGVAHDINNLLTVIQVNAAELPPGRPRDMIAEQCQLGGRLARKLQLFASDGPHEKAVFDLRNLLSGSRELLASIVGSSVRLVLDLPPGPLPILADLSEMEQVLLNLAVNARDAMPGGGELALRAYAVDDDVLLDVHDTGSGIPPQLKERIFEPFFTTKQEQGGSGLGLATAYGAMRRCQGSISVSSAPDQGTTFSLRWRRAHL